MVFVLHMYVPFSVLHRPVHLAGDRFSSGLLLADIVEGSVAAYTVRKHCSVPVVSLCELVHSLHSSRTVDSSNPWSPSSAGAWSLWTLTLGLATDISNCVC